MLIPYGIQTYTRSDFPRMRLVNLYAEKTPAPVNPAQVTLLPRPAMQTYRTFGTDAIRGVFQQPGVVDGSIITVSGTTLYNDATAIGTLTTSADRVVMAGTLTGVLIADTNLYSTDGEDTTQIAFPDNAAVSWVGFLGGYAFALRRDTRRIYFTLDPSTWDGLDYVAAEQSTGNTVGAAIVGDQLWVFSERVTEIFVLTGDPDTPIQAVQGRVFDKGALTRDSIVPFDNTVVWVGHDRIVYRAAGTPTRISDHGIEERLALTSDASAWDFAWIGHSFYVLRTDDGTVAYDAATQQWTEFGSYGRPFWTGWLGTITGTMTLVGDSETGTLWKLADGVYQDGTAVIERVFPVLLNQAGFMDNISIDYSGGHSGAASAEPGVIELRTSRDGGETFGSWRQTSLGLQGRYRQRIAFRSLGLVDQANMLCEFRVTDPRPSRISNVRINEALSGRSR